MKTKLGLLAALATFGAAPLVNAADLDDRYYDDRSGGYYDRSGGYYDRSGYEEHSYEDREVVVVRRRPARVIEDDFDGPEVIYYSDTSPRYPYAYGIRPYRFGNGFRHPRHRHHRRYDTWQARGRW